MSSIIGRTASGRHLWLSCREALGRVAGWGAAVADSTLWQQGYYFPCSHCVPLPPNFKGIFLCCPLYRCREDLLPATAMLTLCTKSLVLWSSFNAARPSRTSPCKSREAAAAKAKPWLHFWNLIFFLLPALRSKKCNLITASELI